MTPPNRSPMLTLADAADFVGVSTRTLRRKIQAGELTAHRFGRLLRISEADLTAFLEEHRNVSSSLPTS